MSYHRTIVVGNLGADPEVRQTNDGTAVAELRLAVNERWKTGEHTEWYRVVFFGRQAEVAQEYLTKGRQVLVEGRMRTEKYTDRDGVERYSVKLMGDQLKLIGHRGEGGEKKAAPAKREPKQPELEPARGEFDDEFSDQIPF